MVVQGQGPGPRYGHVMDLVGQRYLVTVSGNDGETFALNCYVYFCVPCYLCNNMPLGEHIVKFHCS